VRTDFQNPLIAALTAPTNRHGSARTHAISTDTFSRSLATASRNLAGASSNAPARVLTPSAVSRMLRTASTGSNSSNSVISQGKTHIVTPFGAYDIAIPNETLPTQSTDTPDQWKDYFCTHQPLEWSNNPVAREHFAAIYGDKALVTLDYTGTVPENVESVWVTHVPVDASGKPIVQV
jgi:hypothetical protein